MQRKKYEEDECLKGEQDVRGKVCEYHVEWRTKTNIYNLKVSCDFLSNQVLSLLSNHYLSLG